ncbi:unnamed protein product, partial [Symbiodinium microadriaticum]
MLVEQGGALLRISALPFFVLKFGGKFTDGYRWVAEYVHVLDTTYYHAVKMAKCLRLSAQRAEPVSFKKGRAEMGKNRKRCRLDKKGATAISKSRVEGTPDLSVAASLAFSWQHQSCEASFIGHVAEALGAELDVQALSGIGIMQNAQKEAYFSGSETMLSYWSR